MEILHYSKALRGATSRALEPGLYSWCFTSFLPDKYRLKRDPSQRCKHSWTKKMTAAAVQNRAVPLQVCGPREPHPCLRACLSPIPLGRQTGDAQAGPSPVQYNGRPQLPLCFQKQLVSPCTSGATCWNPAHSVNIWPGGLR